MYLGDFGAEVIKVEHPKGDPVRSWGTSKNGVSLWWKMLSRNKKAITLDLGLPKGQELFKKLIEKTDILIENFRPSVMEKWGLGYDSLQEVNPKLVMVRVSGFGQSGPYKDKPFFGTLGEAMSGFAEMTGLPDGPPTLPPFGLADGIAAIAGAFAAMVALYFRDTRTGGRGQVIDLAIYEPILTVLGCQPLEYDQLGLVPQRTGNRFPGAAPRNAYRTRDGRWVALSASSQRLAERTFQAIGRPDLVTDPRFRDNRSRLQHVEELDQIIGEWMAAHDLKEVLEIFDKHEAAVGPIYNITDIFADQHFQARETLVQVDDPELGILRMQNVMARFSRTPGEIRHAGPKLGQHNREIYVERLGLREAQLTELKREGVV